MSAFLSWMRDEMPRTDEGKQQWRQVCDYIDTPPVTVIRVRPDTPTAPARRALPRGAPPGSPTTPEAQASAFAAFMGSGVGA